MPILLFRVDDRLIHGQVVVGWGSRLDLERYVVVDDSLAGAEWERELYALGVPDAAEAEFVTVEEARSSMDRWATSDLRTVLLVRNLSTLLRLAEGGVLSGFEVNLGGIHHKPGSTRVLPYLYLHPDDRERLRALEEEGVAVSARDLPGSPKVDLDRLLSRSG